MKGKPSTLAPFTVDVGNWGDSTKQCEATVNKHIYAYNRKKKHPTATF